MCILVTKPEGTPWPIRRTLRTCYDNNPDGAGFAYVDGGKVVVRKGYFSFKALWRDVRELADRAAVLHFRQATHGSISAENCHPFLLANGCALAHNGIINIAEYRKDMTDSESFGRFYVERFSGKELQDERVRLLMEAAIGSLNKMAILMPSGKIIHLNKDSGVEEDGIWYSNRSFEPRLNYYDYEPLIPWVYDAVTKTYRIKSNKERHKELPGRWEKYGYDRSRYCTQVVDSWESCGVSAKDDLDDKEYQDPFYASDRFPGVIEAAKKLG
jgi:hypothetical protein